MLMLQIASGIILSIIIIIAGMIIIGWIYDNL